jgi:hypothetical protein
MGAGAGRALGVDGRPPFWHGHLFILDLDPLLFLCFFVSPVFFFHAVGLGFPGLVVGRRGASARNAAGKLDWFSQQSFLSTAGEALGALT